MQHREQALKDHVIMFLQMPLTPPFFKAECRCHAVESTDLLEPIKFDEQCCVGHQKRGQTTDSNPTSSTPKS